jgi:hypothetical protein
MFRSVPLRLFLLYDLGLNLLFVLVSGFWQTRPVMRYWTIEATESTEKNTVYMVLKSNRISAETIDLNEPNTSKHNKYNQICMRIKIAKV